MRSPVRAAFGLMREGLWALELPKLALAAPELARLPRGNGEPVLVLPGFATSDASTALLRAFLRALGWRVAGWNLGVNTGAVQRQLPQLVDRVAERSARLGAPIRMVGWSLGGYLAREVARARPELVHRVVTLGSPVMARRAAPRAPRIAVPITAIYSRADGIVHWRACIDRESPDVEHVEVGATHIGLGFSAEVYGVVADRLSRAR